MLLRICISWICSIYYFVRSICGTCDCNKRKRDLKFIFWERIYYEKVRVNDISKKGKKNKLKIKKSNKVRK